LIAHISQPEPVFCKPSLQGFSILAIFTVDRRFHNYPRNSFVRIIGNFQVYIAIESNQASILQVSSRNLIKREFPAHALGGIGRVGTRRPCQNLCNRGLDRRDLGQGHMLLCMTEVLRRSRQGSAVTNRITPTRLHEAKSDQARRSLKCASAYRKHRPTIKGCPGGAYGCLRDRSPHTDAPEITSASVPPGKLLKESQLEEYLPDATMAPAREDRTQEHNQAPLPPGKPIFAVIVLT